MARTKVDATGPGGPARSQQATALSAAVNHGPPERNRLRHLLAMFRGWGQKAQEVQDQPTAVPVYLNEVDRSRTSGRFVGELAPEDPEMEKTRVVATVAWHMLGNQPQPAGTRALCVGCAEVLE